MKPYALLYCSLTVKLGQEKTKQSTLSKSDHFNSTRSVHKYTWILSKSVSSRKVFSSLFGEVKNAILIDRMTL